MDEGTPDRPAWPFDPFAVVEQVEEQGPWPADPFAREAASKRNLDGAWPGDPFAREAEAGHRGSQWLRGRGRRRRGRRSGERSDLGFLARGSILNLAGVVTNTLFTFVLVLVVTHKLGEGQAGVFFVSIALFTIISNTAELGADGGLLRMIPRYRATKRTQDIRRTVAIGLWPCLVVSVAGAALMWVFAPQLVNLFFRVNRHGRSAVEAIPFVRALAFFLPVSALSTVILAGTRGFGAMLPAVTVENVGKPVARPILVLGAILAGLPLAAVAVAWAGPIVVGFVAALGWLLWLIRRAERRDAYSGPPRAVGDLAPEFWRFAAPRGLAGALNTSQTWLNTLFVGGLASTGEAAIYTAASRFIMVGSFAIQAMQLVVAPQIAGLLALEDKQRARTVYQTATQWLMAPSWPIYYTLAFFAPVMLRVYRPGYEAGQTVLTVLSLSLLVAMATGPVSIVLVMGGKSGWTLLNSAVGLAVMIALNGVLIPRYGIEGAAVAAAVGIVVQQVSMLVQVRVFLGLNPIGRGALLVAAASTAIYGGLGLLVRMTVGASIPSFLVYLAVATALYLLFIWRFRKTLQLTEIARALKGRNIRRMTRPAGDWSPAT